MAVAFIGTTETRVNDSPAGAWVLAGWGMLALTGVAGGAWLASTHARPGAGFLVALVGGMVLRLTVVATAVSLAALTGGAALRAHLEGLVLGFFPLQVHEVVFFRREARRRAGAR